ncbi:type II secretion system protein, partial [bacterium]|nr:type II secretion system protein [bacterium]
LAETLIVMGIIGVVAALTLPNLNSSTGDKEKVAKVKKIYSNLNDAFGRAQAVYGPFSDWYPNGISGFTSRMALYERCTERIVEFMKIQKNCKFESGCFSNTDTKNLSGSNGVNLDIDDFYHYILADGTSLAFNLPDGEAADGTMQFAIIVDVDGPNKGVNTWGKDLFQFQINSEEGNIVPDSVVFRDNEEMRLKKCFGTGAACTAWVIRNDNLDYLKADSNGICKNSNIQLSWDNISCK